MAKQINSKIYLILAGALVGVVLLVYGLEKTGVIDLFKDSKPSNGPTSEQQAIETQVNADAKRKFIEDSQNSQESSPNDKPASKIELSANKESDGTVTVFTKLPGVSSGNCMLKVTNGGVEKEYSASIIYQTEYSICAGYSVRISDIGHGSWTLLLSVNSNDQIQTKSITYQVQ